MQHEPLKIDINQINKKKHQKADVKQLNNKRKILLCTIKGN